ncbi:MAG: T9SS type A sorting domain-containing protein, partial [Bacteroidales bacterium]|nr:T9SS type A sorting domain-containing protein [Bacteroidales bacterium]
EGNVKINGNDITNLNRLNVLTAFGGSFSIDGNSALTSLSGLDNVTSIGGSLWIQGNASLTSLTALDNITSIWISLNISHNDALTNLSGLDNIDAASIDNLYIYCNISLSTCEVESICNYLTSPNGVIEILENASGCNSPDEVEAACEVGVTNINFESEFSIYPNPTEKELFISVRNGAIINEVNIYNRIAQKVLHEHRITNTIDVSMLKQGMYIIELVTNKSKIREKLIIR